MTIAIVRFVQGSGIVRGALPAAMLAAVLLVVPDARAQVGAPGQPPVEPATAAKPQDATCTAEDLAKAVNSAGAELRRVNGEALPRLRLKMQVLRERKSWSEAEYEAQSMAMVADERTADFDQQATAHLERIDVLSRSRADVGTDCAVVAEIRARSIELVATVRAKSDYALERLDQAIAATATARPAPPSASNPTLPASTPQQVTVAPAPPVQPPAPKTSAPAPAVPPAQTRSQQAVAAAKPQSPVAPPTRAAGWETTTSTTSTSEPVAAANTTGPQGPGVYIVPGDSDGYTIDEIQDATRGFFGQVSTGLASVIEHAFQKAGRPTAYVLGNEGGGAFLAGLRYGEGTLYLRRGGSRKIYWHGPSVGGDVGLSGTKTLFLIYQLDAPEGLYSRFTGIDGSAFFVGGVGFTLLTNGRVLMAPIRSGVGFRLGASIGYLRFTEQQTWNPF